jgi:hypothetical protein
MSLFRENSDFASKLCHCLDQYLAYGVVLAATYQGRVSANLYIPVLKYSRLPFSTPALNIPSPAR